MTPPSICPKDSKTCTQKTIASKCKKYEQAKPQEFHN